MLKHRAELSNEQGTVAATFNETCHDWGGTFATVRLRPPLAPFTLQGTESLDIFAEGSAEPVISVHASDPAGTEICEFHGRSALGCLPDGTKITLVKSPGGDLNTLLIVIASGTVKL